METHLRERVMKKFPNTRKPLTGGCVGSFEISEGNITGRGNTHTHTHTHTHTEYTPNHNSQKRSSPDAHVSHQRVGVEQGGAGCMLRVRTRPECPEDNLRELT